MKKTTDRIVRQYEKRQRASNEKLVRDILKSEAFKALSPAIQEEIEKLKASGDYANVSHRETFVGDLILKHFTDKIP